MFIDEDIAHAFKVEAALRADIDTAVAVKCGLEGNLQDPREAQTPFSRINLFKYFRLKKYYEKHLAVVMRHRQEIFDLRTHLHELHNKIDVQAFLILQESNAPELSEYREVAGFYGLSYKRITAFQECLRQFRINLGSARAAMSASYRKDQHAYSASTQEVMEEAMFVAKELDGEIRNINALAHELEDRTFGVQPAMLPRFNERGYENLIMEAFLCEIVEAHINLENILNECEGLDVTEISTAYLTIEDAQQSHQDQTDALVRKIWQEAQRQFLSGNYTKSEDET